MGEKKDGSSKARTNLVEVKFSADEFRELQENLAAYNAWRARQGMEPITRAAWLRELAVRSNFVEVYRKDMDDLPRRAVFVVAMSSAELEGFIENRVETANEQRVRDGKPAMTPEEVLSAMVLDWVCTVDPVMESDYRAKHLQSLAVIERQGAEIKELRAQLFALRDVPVSVPTSLSEEDELTLEGMRAAVRERLRT